MFIHCIAVKKYSLILITFSGDAGYPLEPWLMTPLPNYPEGTRQFHYTKQHCKSRNAVERFFGVFKGTWRCLSYQRVLMYEPHFAGCIIHACGILHNMRLRYQLPVEQYFDEEEVRGPGINRHVGDENIVARGNVRGPRAIGERIQRQIIQERFGVYRDGDPPRRLVR